MSSQTAHQVMQSLPTEVQEATIVCPLCGSVTPVTGLRPRSGNNGDTPPWQLLFTCPACGLITAFNTTHLSLKQIESFQGSAWTTDLHHFQQEVRQGELRYQRRATRKHFIGVFFVSFLTWMLLIGNFNPVEILWGVIASLLITRFTYQFLLFDFWQWIYEPRRWWELGKLVLEFWRQLIVQNVTLAVRVFHPNLPIRPGILAIPTRLRTDGQLTLLGSLVSLTPDTVTIDIDQEKGIIYVHWIDVQTTDPQEAHQLVIASLEDKIVGWLGE
ncbi:MAG: Na+/H+ antiporter subunit E [Chloroflexi bacterium]|nr:Na+/H+ antiporter subunit E [Chloroflexota bacterium]MBP8055644.1 Na+/H+ antiporter subunit E [Chloroflexota bacterium]